MKKSGIAARLSVFGAALCLGTFLPLLGSLTQANPPSAPVARDEKSVNQQLPLLSTLTRPSPPTYEAFLDYATAVLKPAWIKNENDLLSLYACKDQLKGLLVGFCNISAGGINGPNSRDPAWPAMEKELAVLGIQAYFAEGDVAGLSDGPFLEDVIERVASEPCRLFIHMKNVQTKASNHEYVYMDLDADMKMVEIGERFLKSFPDSKFAGQMRDMLYDSLVPLTDVHYVGSSIYIVGGTSKDVYPGWTVIENHRKFIKTHLDSRFRGVVARIIGNISDISGGGPIYAVVTDVCPSEKEARRVVYSYLLQGLDIPHILTGRGDQKSTFIAYRFFSDKRKADMALSEIRKIKPQASIRIL